MAGLTTSQAAGVAAFMGFLAGLLVILVVVGIIYYVLLVIAWWKLFTKAGEKGWKAIIPFYNYYVQCKLTWAPKFFWIIIVLSVLAGVIGGMVQSMTGTVQVIMSFVTLAAYIAVIVLGIISDYRLAKAYGHGGGYTVGLIFLNFIFMLILGLGKSKYQGNVYLKDQKKKK